MNQALLVIDLIKGLEKWIPQKRIKKILPNVKNVLEKTRKKEFPIIFIVHKPLGKKGTKIYDEVAPNKNDIIIKKNDYSSFYKTNLDKILRKMKVKQLIITGISTHWCVLTTCLDAYYRKYKIILLRDCTTAPDDRKHKLAIEWMKDTFPIIIKNSKKLW